MSDGNSIISHLNKGRIAGIFYTVSLLFRIKKKKKSCVHGNQSKLDLSDRNERSTKRFYWTYTYYYVGTLAYCNVFCISLYTWSIFKLVVRLSCEDLKWYAQVSYMYSLIVYIMPSAARILPRRVLRLLFPSERNTSKHSYTLMIMTSDQSTPVVRDKYRY